MRAYDHVLEQVLFRGYEREDRTGVGTYSLFSPGPMVFDLEDGFPAITRRKLFYKGTVAELIWFLNGQTNIHDLPEYVRSWWEPWADEFGDLGPIYGFQWRGVTRRDDQIRALIEGLRDNPMSRRHIVSAWNAPAIRHMALPPCHVLTQFYVEHDGRLSAHLYQRSGDLFLGVPHNIASYATLIHLVAKVVGRKPGRLHHTIGDAHVYKSHRDAVIDYLGRNAHPLPSLHIEGDVPLNLRGLDHGQFRLEDYEHSGRLSAPLAV